MTIEKPRELCHEIDIGFRIAADLLRIRSVLLTVAVLAVGALVTSRDSAAVLMAAAFVK